MTFDEYVKLKDGQLQEAQYFIDRARRIFDHLTAGTWDDMPEDLTPEQRHRIQRAAFAAMNTDWDLASARRTFQAARDRMIRDDARTTAGTTTGDASPRSN